VPTPELDVGEAAKWLRDNFVPNGQRVRLYDINGLPVIDSYEVTENIPGQVLPPARPAGTPPSGEIAQKTLRDAEHKKAVEAEVAAEVERALAGEPQTTVRRNESGERVVSVSIPIQHVRAVLGVLTLEAGDVDEIISAERKALLPFIVVAMVAIVMSSVLLHRLIAVPVLRLARAADHVRLQGARAISLPDLSERRDELGDLSRSLEDMTHSLSERMDAIERFAADVAHEIKNPLTSIRSAIETLPLVTDPTAQSASC
jgi:two-component system, OmpR family, sensor histidine kinase ChvG